MNVAFAGFRHGHVYSILEAVRSNPGLVIVAAWEADKASVIEAEKHGITDIYSDYDKMLYETDIDILVVCDCYSARGDKIIKALGKGINVYCDKPVCTSLVELYEIERLTREKKLHLGCMLDLRCTGAATAAKEIVGRGWLGKIHNISFGGQHPLNYGSRPSWYFEDGCQGGTINDIAIHGIDLIRYITGKGLKSVVAARSWNAYAAQEPGFKDCAQFMAVLDGDTGLIADVSYSMPYPLSYDTRQGWRFTFWGEAGIMEFKATDDFIFVSLKNENQVKKIWGEHLIANPLDEFLNELSGREALMTTAAILKASEDTLKIQEICDN